MEHYRFYYYYFFINEYKTHGERMFINNTAGNHRQHKTILVLLCIVEPISG